MGHTLPPASVFRSPLPDKFEPGFLAQTNKSTLLYKQLRRAFDEIIDDLGGQHDLSHIKASLENIKNIKGEGLFAMALRVQQRGLPPLDAPVR